MNTMNRSMKTKLMTHCKITIANSNNKNSKNIFKNYKNIFYEVVKGGDFAVSAIISFVA